MANPFDQFDTPAASSNPFDQFDTPAPAPQAVSTSDVPSVADVDDANTRIAAAKKKDGRSTVDFSEAAWRKANEAAAGTEGLLSSAASVVGYPITAADAALSGRDIPSLGDTVEAARAPSERDKAQYAIDPSKEKLTFGGQLGAGVGQAGTDLLTMAASGPTKVAEAGSEGAGILSQAFSKLGHTAVASSVPASRNAQDVAQQAIDSGATPEQAARAAFDSFDQTVTGNLMPVGVKGSLAVRTASGGAIGGAQAAAEGGDAQSIATGAIMGAGMSATMGERPSAPTGVAPPTRAQALADEVIASAAAKGDPSAKGIQDGDAILKQAGVPTNTTETATAVQQASANAAALDKSVGFTDNATPADQSVTSSPVSTLEPMNNGKRVLFRGDVDQMRALLDQSDVPPGMTKLENGKPVGIYYPQSYKDKVSKALNYSESDNGNAPSQVENTQTQNAARTQNTEDAVAGTSAGDEGRQRPVQSSLDGDKQPAADDNTAVIPFTPEERQQQKAADLANAVPNLSDEQKAAIQSQYPQVTRDRVTNFHKPEELDPTIIAAQKSGQSSTYVSMDLRNLGGLNAHMGSNEAANTHISAVANIVKNEMDSLGGTAVPIRQGGDELGFVIRGVNAEDAHTAMAAASQKIDAYSKDNGLDSIPHPKGKDAGFGIHYGAVDIDSASRPRDIIQRADKLVESRKQGDSYEFEKQAEATGTGSRPAGEVEGSASPEGSGAGREVSAVKSNEPGYASANPSGIADRGNAEAALVKQYGQGAVTRLKKNGVQFVNAEDIAAKQIGGHKSLDDLDGVKGFTPADRSSTYIVNDRVKDEDAAGVLKHELVHKNMGTLLEQPRFQALQKAALTSQDKDVAAARLRVPQSTPKQHIGEETLGYLAEQKPTHPYVQKMVDQVKLTLNRIGVPLDKIAGEGAALRKIIALNLQHASDLTGKDAHLVSEPAGLTQKPRIRVPVDDVPVNRIADAPGDNTTGIKNAQVNAERVAAGKTPLESEASQTFGSSWDKAKDTAANDDTAGRTLAQSILDKPRAVSQDEAALLLHDRVRIHNAHKDATAEIAKAMDAGDENAETLARVKLKQLEEQMDTNDRASRAAGSESGRSLNARKMMAADDYSLAALVQKGRAASGNKLSDADRATLEKQAARIEELQKLVDEASSKAPAPRIARTPAGKKTLDDQMTAMVQRLKAVATKPETAPLYSKDEVVAKIGQDNANVINAIAKNRVMAGAETPEQLVSSIHDAVKDILPISPRDVSDVISGYDHIPKPTQNEIQLRLNALKKQLRDGARKQDVAAGIKQSPQDVTRQKAQQKEIDKLESQLKTGYFSKPGKTPPVYNEATVAKQAELNRLRQQVDMKIKQIARDSRSNPEKVADFIVSAHKGMILTSPLVVPKLLLAAAYQNVFTPINQAVGSALRHLPGIKQIASQAPRQGAGFSAGTEARALANAWGKKAFKEMYDTAKSGITDRTALYGDTSDMDPSFVRFIGNIHSALKTPAKRQEFLRSMEIRSAFERNRVISEGMTPAQANAHMADPATQAMLGAKAYIDEKAAIFQGDNWLSDAFKRMGSAAEQKGGAAGATFKKTLDYLFPITKVPTNIAFEVGSYAAGGLKAAGTLAKNQYAYGSMSKQERAQIGGALRNLSPEQSDYIMKNLKQQGVGAAMFAIGYLSSNVGGYYQEGDNKKGLQKPGTIGNVPQFALHAPAMDLIQMGATVKRMQRQTGSTAAAVYAGAKGAADEIPLFDGIGSLTSGLKNYDTAGKFLGQQAKSMVVPPIVSQTAQFMDNGRTRKAKTFTDELKTGIPGLRQTLPQS